MPVVVVLLVVVSVVQHPQRTRVSGPQLRSRPRFRAYLHHLQRRHREVNIHVVNIHGCLPLRTRLPRLLLLLLLRLHLHLLNLHNKRTCVRWGTTRQRHHLEAPKVHPPYRPRVMRHPCLLRSVCGCNCWYVVQEG